MAAGTPHRHDQSSIGPKSVRKSYAGTDPNPAIAALEAESDDALQSADPTITGRLLTYLVGSKSSKCLQQTRFLTLPVTSRDMWNVAIVRAAHRQSACISISRLKESALFANPMSNLVQQSCRRMPL